MWLAKVPQRTIVATRLDGATLRFTGREAREDDERLEQFLAGGSLPADGKAADGASGQDDSSTAGASTPARQVGGERGPSQVHRRLHLYLPGQRDRIIGVACGW